MPLKISHSPDTPTLRLYAKLNAVGVGLLDGQGHETIWHFFPHKQYEGQPDDELAVFGHILTAGAKPIKGRIVTEKPFDVREKYKWMIVFSISQAGYESAMRYAKNRMDMANAIYYANSQEEYDDALQRANQSGDAWTSWQLFGKNCVSFARTLSAQAGIHLPKTRFNVPLALVMKIRGELRAGRMKAERGILPPGITKGVLPENVLTPA